MSTQLNAQQGLTNLTPIKVIHILISLAIMVCFKFVPAAEPLTHDPDGGRLQLPDKRRLLL